MPGLFRRIGRSRGIVLLAGFVVLGWTGAPHASGHGLIVKGETLIQQALSGQAVTFAGASLDPRPLLAGAAGLPFEAHELLIHDHDTGRTRRAPASLALRGISSPEGAPGRTLGELFRRPGDVVAYAGTFDDPERADRYLHVPAFGGSATYLGSLEQPVPEPALTTALGVGGLLLSGLGGRSPERRRRARTTALE